VERVGGRRRKAQKEKLKDGFREGLWEEVPRELYSERLLTTTNRKAAGAQEGATEAAFSALVA
jgi:hypothetical protein